MSRILMNIAGGYMRGEILKRIDDNPTRTPQDVVADWIDGKFGNYIRTAIDPKTGEPAYGSPFVFTDIIVEGEVPNLTGRFIIDFENPNDEDHFVRHAGGKIIPSEGE